MKKLLIYSSIIILLFAALYFLNQQSDKDANQSLAAPAEELYESAPEDLHPGTRDQLTDQNYQKVILPAELKSKLDQEEDTIVYFYDPTCRYCQETTPILTELAEETGADFVQYNLLEFSEGRSLYNIQSWPIIVSYKDGQEVDRITGGITTDEQREKYRSFLEKYK